MKWLPAACLLMAVPALARGEPAADWTYPVTYRGKPVAGAKVGLVPFTYANRGATKATEPIFVTTDDKGEARIPKPGDRSLSGSARLLARDTTGRGGYGYLFGENHRYPPTLELLDNAELIGRVTDANAKPVPGLKLQAVALGPESFDSFGGRQTVYTDTPDWFWAAFPARVAGDGSFTLPGVPVTHSVAVRFEAPGFGSGRFWVFPGKSAAIALQKPGAVRLRFTAAPDAKPGDIEVTATRTNSDQLEKTASGTAKAGGELTLSDLPPGQYQIGFPYTGPAAVFPKAVDRITVKPGTTATVSIPLEPAAQIKARLIDSKTGKGVAGATLYVDITRGAGEPSRLPAAQADAEGKVALLIPAGMVAISPGAAEGYAAMPFSGDRFHSGKTEAISVGPGKTHDFGAFALVRTVDFAGLVVDDAGKPVAGANVMAGYSEAWGSSTVSDGNGHFVIKGVNPEGGLFGVTARKDSAITAVPVAVDPAKQDGAIRLVVAAKFAARVRVRAVDRTGKPVAGADVNLNHSWTAVAQGSGPIGWGIGMKVAATPPDGRFKSDVLQAGDRYQLSLSAPGCRTASTPEWTAVAGETHDFGDVVLTRGDLAVSGSVTDRKGKPVAGAAVFDNTDGPKPAATTTDAAGQFVLGGLYEGLAFVSIRAEGFRLASVPAAPGGPAAAVSLRRLTDPPAPPPVISDAHKAATAQLTRHLLETMWANRLAAMDDGKLVIRSMATFDPATARKWRDEEKARTSGKVDLSAEIETAERERTLLPTARDDPDEAVALLRPVEGSAGFQAVCQLARQLLPDAPDKALRVAEEAVVRARGMPEADRSWALAQAGELVFRAGKKDAGRKLIEEAAKLVEPLGFEELDSYRRGMVGCRVALFDPARARALIDPIQSIMEFNRWLAQACSRVATTNLRLAKQWLADFRPESINSLSREFAPGSIACWIARTNPDEAIAIAEQIESPSIRAHTLAALATRLQDKARVARLIDAALDGIVANPTGYYNDGACTTAGLLLFRAKQIHHPDLAAVRDKVLAARTAPSAGLFAESNGRDVKEALVLALTDPDTARVLLGHDFSPKDGALANLLDRQGLLAFALADPAALMRLVDALVAETVKQNKTGYQQTEIGVLARVLTQPDRLQDVFLYAGLFGESQLVEE